VDRLQQKKVDYSNKNVLRLLDLESSDMHGGRAKGKEKFGGRASKWCHRRRREAPESACFC